MGEYIFRIDGAYVNEETGEACMKPEILEEIIRCRDCRYWDDFPTSTVYPEYHKCKMVGKGFITEESGFCCYGSRRDDQPKET